MRYVVRQKLCVCTRLKRHGIWNCVHFWLHLCIQRAVHYPPFSPPASFMALVHLKPLLDVCLWEEKSAVIISTALFRPS